jgi:hypothetical protein
MMENETSNNSFNHSFKHGEHTWLDLYEAATKAANKNSDTSALTVLLDETFVIVGCVEVAWLASSFAIAIAIVVVCSGETI